MYCGAFCYPVERLIKFPIRRLVERRRNTIENFSIYSRLIFQPDSVTFSDVEIDVGAALRRGARYAVAKKQIYSVNKKKRAS